MAADTARHLHGSLTLQDCSQGLGACGCGLKDGGSGGHEGLQTGWWCLCVCVCVWDGGEGLVKVVVNNQFLRRFTDMIVFM